MEFEPMTLHNLAGCSNHYRRLFVIKCEIKVFDWGLLTRRNQNWRARLRRHQPNTFPGIMGVEGIMQLRSRHQIMTWHIVYELITASHSHIEAYQMKVSNIMICFSVKSCLSISQSVCLSVLSVCLSVCDFA